MDRNEFTRIVDRYYDDVKRIPFAGCKNIYDSEDIAQTVFMKLSQYRGDFENDEHIKKWLIKVAVNEYRSLWRNPWKTRVEYNLPERSANNSYNTNRDLQNNTVLEAVMSLKRKYREIIHLFYYEEYSAKEIGKLLEVSESTVFKRLQRAREQIKKYLQNKECTDDFTAENDTICKAFVQQRKESL